jgi:hypothetical protein
MCAYARNMPGDGLFMLLGIVIVPDPVAKMSGVRVRARHVRPDAIPGCTVRGFYPSYIFILSVEAGRLCPLG